jgi:stage II sporulation protein D
MAAAMAQAVAARTYAHAHQNQHADLGFDLYATIQDQVYGGISVEDDLINQAVDQTRSQILVYLGRPVEAKYHSTCGGRTADFGDAWPGEGPPYLRSVICGYCRPSPHYEWKKIWLKNDFFANLRTRLPRLGINLDQGEYIRGLRLFKNKQSLRVRKILIQTTKSEYSVSVYNIRTLLGDNRDPGGLLKSNWFGFKARGDTLVIEGRGFGHGVGMCQWGCLEMARTGKNYRQILQLYYPGTIIKKR